MQGDDSNSPIGQEEQVAQAVALVAVMYVPAPQVAQVLCSPRAVEYVPTPQPVQESGVDIPMPVEYVPGPHKVQAASVDCPNLG